MRNVPAARLMLLAYIALGSLVGSQAFGISPLKTAGKQTTQQPPSPPRYRHQSVTPSRCRRLDALPADDIRMDELPGYERDPSSLQTNQNVRLVQRWCSAFPGWHV